MCRNIIERDTPHTDSIVYESCEEKLYLENETHVVYGISAKDADGFVISQISDVTADRNEIERLVSLCNSLELSAIHLHDVVEDFIAE